MWCENRAKDAGTHGV